MYPGTRQEKILWLIGKMVAKPVSKYFQQQFSLANQSLNTYTLFLYLAHAWARSEYIEAWI